MKSAVHYSSGHGRLIVRRSFRFAIAAVAAILLKCDFSMLAEKEKEIAMTISPLLTAVVLALL
jgi:hypothetical protein